MNPASFLGSWNSLDSVYTGFILQGIKNTGPANPDRLFVHLYYFPALFCGMADVHAEQVIAPVFGFVAACSAANFKVCNLVFHIYFGEPENSDNSEDRKFRESEILTL